jgi:protein CpxP
MGVTGAILLATTSISLLALSSKPVAAQSATEVARPVPMPQNFAGDVEIRIADLHNALAITPAQEALFRAYGDAMRANAQTISALFQQRAAATDFSAPARLRWYAQLTATHAEAVNKLIAPFDALYQSLSGPQRVAADRHFEQLQQRRLARGTR